MSEVEIAIMPYFAFIVGLVVTMVLSMKGHEVFASWVLGASLAVCVCYEIRVGLLSALDEHEAARSKA